MNNYQQLQKNLHELKLTQISLQIDDYINKINEHKLSIVDALCELTSKEVEVKNFNAAHAMVKVAAFPHLKELKDFDFEFQPKINRQLKSKSENSVANRLKKCSLRYLFLLARSQRKP